MRSLSLRYYTKRVYILWKETCSKNTDANFRLAKADKKNFSDIFERPVFEMFPPTAVISFTNHIQQHSTSNSDQYLLFCFNQFENNVSVPPALKFLRRCPLVMIFQYLRRQEYCKSTHTIFEKSKVQSADVTQNFRYLLKLHTNNCRNSVLKFGW